MTLVTKPLTVLTGFLAMWATAQAYIVSHMSTDTASNTSQLAPRGMEVDEIIDSYQYKQLTTTIDFSKLCPGKSSWIHDVYPKVRDGVDKISFITCSFKKPVHVDNWNFTRTNVCADDRDVMRPKVQWVLYGKFGAATRMMNGVEHDIVHQINFHVCVRDLPGTALWGDEPNCWGEWIKEPAWDYEWKIKVPWDGIIDKQRCGEKFEKAIRDACDPYEQTLFECEPHPPGAWIRVRHALLCGRSRIEKAIREASGQWTQEEHCPYFVEVPVPR